MLHIFKITWPVRGHTNNSGRISQRVLKRTGKESTECKVSLLKLIIIRCALPSKIYNILLENFGLVRRAWLLLWPFVHECNLELKYNMIFTTIHVLYPHKYDVYKHLEPFTALIFTVVTFITIKLTQTSASKLKDMPTSRLCWC